MPQRKLSYFGIPYKTDSLLYRLRFAIALFALTILTGTIGYMAILGLSFIEALYFTVITLTTIGYGDINPTTGPAGEIFTIIFVLGGIATASYTATVLLSAVVEGELHGALGRERTVRKIHKLHGHVIICGFGRIGRDLAKSFAAEELPFVVIENDEESVDEGRALGYLMTKGDATTDEMLLEAGLESAKTILPVLASDAENVFIIISARQLNPSINIVARATDDASAEKMRRAGTDRVIRPLHIGAQHLAQAVLRPTVLDFMYMSGKTANEEYSLEEVVIAEGSALANKLLSEIGHDLLVGIIVVGIKRENGSMVFNPRGDTKILPRDTIVAMGAVPDMVKLSSLAANPENGN